eukprot:CAMPEP_0197190628 /NCGR_PEP_ID=MMETSP1423-20130617/22034_1 /TAXON_ID=476441 /ORGANISM="Pseudo-nitzschia heimii, Strain UNC1101" /LENGTH=107 /DNA_ID=CAMNT_0042643053 /DNA_START=60 /DNA_END=380 /DNA_ORIENTATION=+
MASKSIIHAALSSAKATISRTVRSTPDSSIAFPLSTMAIAYASALPSKPASNHDRAPEPPNQRPRPAGKRQLGEEPSGAERGSQRFFHSSSAIRATPPVVVRRSSDR